MIYYIGLYILLKDSKVINLPIILLLSAILYFSQCTDNKINKIPSKEGSQYKSNEREEKLRKQFEDLINLMSQIENSVSSLEKKIGKLKNSKTYIYIKKVDKKSQIRKLKYKIHQLKKELYIKKIKYNELLKKLSTNWIAKKTKEEPTNKAKDNKCSKEGKIDPISNKKVKNDECLKDVKDVKDIKDVKYESGDYYLQLGVFKHYNNSQKQKEVIDKLNIKTTIIKKKYYSGIYYEDRSKKNNKNNYSISSNEIDNWKQANLWSPKAAKKNSIDYIEVSPNNRPLYDKILYYVVSKNKHSFKTALELTKFLSQKGYKALIRKASH